MIFVACSGFPIPVSRYWADLPSVEISDTELGIPGDGTLRRWLRESPDGFGFSVLAPKVIAESGFAKTKENRQLVTSIGEVAKKLGAHAVVFRATDAFKPTRPNRAALKAFFEAIPKRFPAAIILDLQGFSAQQMLTASGGRAIPAYDPLVEEGPGDENVAYARLPGPAGRRSRYDEDTLQTIADHLQALEAKTVFCVFRNADMHVNATSLLRMVS